MSDSVQFYIAQFRGDGGTLDVTAEPPTYLPPQDTTRLGGGKAKTQPAIGFFWDHPKTKHPRWVLVRNGRTDYVRRVVREDDAFDIQQARRAVKDAEGVLREKRVALQKALRSAWPVAKSVTVREAKAATDDSQSPVAEGGGA